MTSNGPSMTSPAPVSLGADRRVDSKAVGAFLAVAFLLAFAIDGLIAVTGGLGSSFATLALVARMATPLLAVLVVCRLVTRQSWLASTGLAPGGLRSRGWLRALGWATLGSALVLLGIALVTVIAVAFGWMGFDAGAGAALEQMRAAAPGVDLPPVWVLVLVSLVGAVVSAYTVNAVFALGEEAGWRGWLLLELAPLGTARVVAVIGVVWGLWHAPLIVMGYQYAHQIPSALGIILFTGFAIAIGTLLTWVRIRSGSVYAAAIVHGAVNAFVTLPSLALPAGEEWNMPLSSAVGVPGVVIFGLLAWWLVSRASWRELLAHDLRR